MTEHMDTPDIEATLILVKEALAASDWQGAVTILEALRPPDQAGLFGELPPEEQDILFPRLSPDDMADILEELEEDEAAEVAGRLGVESLAQILDHMEADEAADLLGDIPPEHAEDILDRMIDAEEVRPLLIHADESAGGLMTSVEVTLNKKMSVEEAICYLRENAPDTETIYYLFVVDVDNRLAGVVSLRQLVISEPEKLIEEILDSSVIHILADADQEEAARLLSRYDLLALPVVDEEMHLLGVITVDDLIEVLEEEATEDIYRLGGVPDGQPTDASVVASTRNRLPWLALNLITAMASATVLSMFENTIAQVAVLAAFFPVVAGVSGSAGTQTLTVTVRGLALGEIALKTGMRTLRREIIIGIINGIVVGSLVATIAYFWKDEPILGLVVGLATLLNMITAGFAGVVVPLLIQALKIDPALASPILVTTTTDTLGYLVYLGLATMFIINLI